MNPLRKAPYEQFPVYFNFSAELLGNENINSYTITCINTDNLSNSASAIIDDSEISGVKIKVTIKNGEIDEKHKITVKIATDLDNEYEKDIVLLIIYDDQSRFEKQPSEQFLILNDFKNELTAGETISTKDISVVRIDDEALFTSSMIYLGIISGTRIIVGVQNGSDGEFYRIVIQIVTSTGNKFQKNIVMGVYEE